MKPLLGTFTIIAQEIKAVINNNTIKVTQRNELSIIGLDWSAMLQSTCLDPMWSNYVMIYVPIQFRATIFCDQCDPFSSTLHKVLPL